MVRVVVVVLASVASVAVANARAASAFRGTDALEVSDLGLVFESQAEAAALDVGEDVGKEAEGEGHEVSKDEGEEAGKGDADGNGNEDGHGEEAQNEPTWTVTADASDVLDGEGQDPSVIASSPSTSSCLLSDWEPLTECDAATLTQSFVKRVVSLTDAADCVDITQRRKCKPVHCSMGKWSAWSPCDPLGFMERTRPYINGPLYGGRACPHSQDRVRCHPDDCLVGWWSDGVCDPDTGRKTRTREIVREAGHQGRKCPSELEEEQACAPVDCALSDDEYEAAWGACDANNEQHRDRKIRTAPRYGGEPCPLRETVWDTRPCGAVDCVWERESGVPFGECEKNETSNAWFKTKVLQITTEPTEDGMPCPSVSERTITKLCTPQPCVMDEWILDGPCSAHGTRRGTRAVLTQAKYGAPECQDQDSDNVPDLDECPPADCDEFFERIVDVLDCDQLSGGGGGGGAYSGNEQQHPQQAPVVVARPKILAIKSQPRYGGRACRPVSECTVEALCKARKQHHQQQQP